MINPESLDLHGFEAQHRLRIQAQQMNWDGAWDHLLRFALHGQGPDASEIGSTWLGSLIEMNALRPFVSWSGTFLRDMEQFFPAARWAITRPGDYRIWAVPLLTDTRVIYYRRAQMQQAGLDPDQAFRTPASLVAALERLQERGVAVPWAMPTRGLDVLYNAASFIWAARGRIRTEDGRHLQLTEPEAQAGLRSFLGLHHFLAPQAQGLDAGETDNLFRAGTVAAALSGPWLLRQLEQDPELLTGVGVAPVPVVPFIGGSHLVMWRHARSEREVFKLVQHLTRPATQLHFFQASGHLPVRLEVLAGEPFASDSRYHALAQSLNTGRVLTVSYRWAAVEQRLVTLLTRLWADVAADPKLDLNVEIAGRVAALVEELEHTLLATW